MRFGSLRQGESISRISYSWSPTGTVTRDRGGSPKAVPPKAVADTVVADTVVVDI